MPVCRYCGKPLPFFQRFAAEEAFCSKEHRQLYQEEFNRLALSRLLQQASGRASAAPVTAPDPVRVPGPEPRRSGNGVPNPAPIAVPAAAPHVERISRTAPVRLPRSPAIRLAEPPLRAPDRPAGDDPGILWPVGWLSLTLLAKSLELAEPEAEAEAETQTPAEVCPAVIAAPEPEQPEPGIIPPRACAVSLDFTPRSPSWGQPQDLLWPGLPLSYPRLELSPLRARMVFGSRAEEPAAPELEPEPEPEVTAPDFSLAARGNAWSRLPWAVRAASLAAIALACGLTAWKVGLQSPAPAAKASPQATASGVLRAVSMGAGGWITKEVSGVGAASQRAISLYRPSMELTDYSIEFTGRIEQGGLGWVARLKDTGNYYAMRLERNGSSLDLVRWTAIDGADAGRVRAPAGPAPDLLRVRLDVRGPRLVTSLGGREVDSFVDHRLQAGGFGFFNEKGFRGRVESVQFFVSSR